MIDYLCIPADTFDRIRRALPRYKVQEDRTHRFVVIDGVTFATPKAPLEDGAS